MEIKNTGYDWCVLDKVRPLNLSQWKTELPFNMEAYFEEKITYLDYLNKIKICELKPNSMPRKTTMFLEYKMYGLVPYNLSPIQQGIQFGHAVVEYGQLSRDVPKIEAIYNKYANKDKTFIILNGGTTNENPDRLGTMQQHCERLKDNGILVAEFREPDLNDTLTACVFLVDERVFKTDIYPNFVKNTLVSDKENEKQYNEWLDKIGGETNEFLRQFLPMFKFA